LFIKCSRINGGIRLMIVKTETGAAEKAYAANNKLQESAPDIPFCTPGQDVLFCIVQ